MKTRVKYFTSESVTEGHPDKVADKISDSILDAILAVDKNGRVACETMVTTNLVLVCGEITTTAKVDYEQIVRNTIKEIGYDKEEYGFCYSNAEVIIRLDVQSADIAQGVDSNEEKQQGAGDQGLMFGYANNESEELMPLPIILSHKLTRRLTTVRKNGTIKYLRPDGKSQVTVKYEDDKVSSIDTILISTQHDENISLEQIREDLYKHVICHVIPSELINNDIKFLVNPTGKFVIGGPHGDAGLTGRKIIVDTYGGYSRHGGGAFSGKDPSKVDRSAAYMARYIAKNIVAAELADKCEVQLSYAIGIAEPTSLLVETFGTAKVAEEVIEDAVKKVFDLRPRSIIETLDLLNPIYKGTAAYGHMGRVDLDVSWERIDKIHALLDVINKK